MLSLWNNADFPAVFFTAPSLYCPKMPILYWATLVNEVLVSICWITDKSKDFEGHAAELKAKGFDSVWNSPPPSDSKKLGDWFEKNVPPTAKAIVLDEGGQKSSPLSKPFGPMLLCESPRSF